MTDYEQRMHVMSVLAWVVAAAAFALDFPGYVVIGAVVAAVIVGLAASAYEDKPHVPEDLRP